jgi:phosphoribosyl-dephospho-CoA transferase
MEENENSATAAVLSVELTRFDRHHAAIKDREKQLCDQAIMLNARARSHWLNDLVEHFNLTFE